MTVKKFVLLLEAYCRSRGLRPQDVQIWRVQTEWRGDHIAHEIQLRIGADRIDVFTLEEAE